MMVKKIIMYRMRTLGTIHHVVFMFYTLILYTIILYSFVYFHTSYLNFMVVIGGI